MYHVDVYFQRCFSSKGTNAGGSGFAGRGKRINQPTKGKLAFISDSERMINWDLAFRPSVAPASEPEPMIVGLVYLFKRLPRRGSSPRSGVRES